MPVCALCDSSQPAGDACDVCGRPFAAAPRGPAKRVEPLDELEPTRHGFVPEPRQAPAEIERTVAEPVELAAAPPVEGFEATSHEPGGDVAAEAIELEPTRAPPVPDERGPRGPIACRYCGTPSTAWEKLCLRCGMRLPVLRPVRAAPPPAQRLCSDCGTPTSGATCVACGARLGGG